MEEVREFLTGVREPAEPERVLATVLFTDIVGSTERARELGDRKWRDLIERHHELVRRDLERFRGREIDTAGDGFLATFDGPARAIRSGRAIVESVRTLGLEIRAGLHTGELALAGEELTLGEVRIEQREHVVCRRPTALRVGIVGLQPPGEQPEAEPPDRGDDVSLLEEEPAVDLRIAWEVGRPCGEVEQDRVRLR